MVLRPRVLVDTREKTPFSFKRVLVSHAALPEGDYALRGDRLGLVIERKSISDLFTTLTHGVERFDRELMRLRPYAYPIIVVEGTPEMIKSGVWNSNANGVRVLDHLLLLSMTHKIHVAFCTSRSAAADLTERLLLARYNYRTGGKI